MAVESVEWAGSEGQDSTRASKRGWTGVSVVVDPSQPAPRRPDATATVAAHPSPPVAHPRPSTAAIPAATVG